MLLRQLQLRKQPDEIHGPQAGEEVEGQGEEVGSFLPPSATSGVRFSCAEPSELRIASRTGAVFRYKWARCDSVRLSTLLSSHCWPSRPSSPARPARFTRSRRFTATSIAKAKTASRQSDTSATTKTIARSAACSRFPPLLNHVLHRRLHPKRRPLLVSYFWNAPSPQRSTSTLQRARPLPGRRSDSRRLTPQHHGMPPRPFFNRTRGETPCASCLS